MRGYSSVWHITFDSVTQIDQGVLKGKNNSITGDRLIAYNSLTEYMGRY